MLCLQMRKLNKKALRILLKYAYPCIEKKLEGKADKLLERIYSSTVEENELEEDLLDILPKLIPTALREINNILKEQGKEEWDEKVIRYYFLERHKDILTEKVLDEFLRNLCLVKIGKVEKVLKKGNELYYKVRFSDGEIRIVKSFERNISEGDLVTVHYYYICEKLRSKDLNFEFE